MSLNSLASSRVAADVAVARDIAVAGRVKDGTSARSLRSASEDTVGPREEDVQNALSALVEYVPAETVTLYLATVASLPVLRASFPALDAWGVYILFAVLTPVLFALIYAGKRRAARQSRWPGLKLWPWWPMAAATMAFLAWGLAVPSGPLETITNGPLLGGLLAIFVSTFLGVLGRFFATPPEERT
jgi:hypothetical protein